MEKIDKVRELFPVTKNKVFLNHAAQSPLPKPVADAVCRYAEDFSNFGDTSIEWDDGGKPLFAKLIGAKKEEIAFIENTSVGMNIAASVLQYPPSSKIVTTNLEYPSVVYPWLRKSLGVKVHYVKNVNGKILLEDVEKAVDNKTVAVAVSHVEYVNGFRNDLRAISEIAHKHGAYLIVDAIQSAGAIPIDVKRDDVDFLATACYKWLLSPPGAGYLYVKEELIEKFEPPFVGWASVKPEVFETIDFWDIWSLRLSETANRFEIGSPSFISFVGATEALKLLLNFGIENIEKRIFKLTDYLMESIKNLGLEFFTPEERQYRSGIVLFKIHKPQELVAKLRQKGIVVSARAHGIRVSPHFYNTENEIDRLIEEIKKW
ncbi:MAG: aminotransferase class V-fold PLP-dependent enzyme [Candidatus Bathyarchaeota archaeon]|jgi:selenocysteine lyase/cysteine desulfurase|nr:aminotransferase class V-fold PLP-dependent enzyme [Candidatus Bathyarchaeota archaeon]